ncbi:hypothetical protein F5878DRAFT_611855 [Lentinula raphanica]|uniref:Cysteine dioxygenase n=1 Tax=Lentinula raphanica TaxID=153919 RepID=A0AA38PDX3_9AGAR|nr:hypothetical protein F5878DRAFT_611855 [Lentinula raphanica]
MILHNRHFFWFPRRLYRWLILLRSHPRPSSPLNRLPLLQLYRLPLLLHPSCVDLRRKPPSPSRRSTVSKPENQSTALPVPANPPAPIFPPLSLNTLHCPYYSAHFPHTSDNGTSSRIYAAADPQKLYANVAGPNIILNTPDFPAFGRAIERSVSTEGCLGYSLLMRKAGEFSKKGKLQGVGTEEKPDLSQTYLRITLGSHMVNSPGIPYVLEIWPAGHYSPIHEHADSFAIIKVLYGTIHAFFYNSLVNSGGPRLIMDKVELKTGDITWISPQHYQVHQLKNLTKRKEDGGEGTVCCTLQCYQYAYNDKVHYENFRYIPNSSESSPTSSANDSGYESEPDMMDFQPNSDMSFGVFKAAIRREWEDYMATDMGRKEEAEFQAAEKARNLVAALNGSKAEGNADTASPAAKTAAEMMEALTRRERMAEMGMQASMEVRAEATMMEIGE